MYKTFYYHFTSAFVLVVHTTAKLIMSRCREDENGGEMNKNARARRAKLQILTAYICKLMTFFSDLCRRCLSIIYSLTIHFESSVFYLANSSSSATSSGAFQFSCIFGRLRKAFQHNMDKINEFIFFICEIRCPIPHD